MVDVELNIEARDEMAAAVRAAKEALNNDRSKVSDKERISIIGCIDRTVPEAGHKTAMRINVIPNQISANAGYIR